MAQKLTIRFVETVRAKRQRTEHRDGYTRGLVLRVTPNGIKSWAVLYRRKSDGRKRRYTIGTYPEFSLADARTQAEAIVARVSRGEDPAAQVQARNAALTFDLARSRLSPCCIFGKEIDPVFRGEVLRWNAKRLLPQPTRLRHRARRHVR